MTDVLPLTTDPESGLPYRLRPAAGRPVARLLLLHGVGGNETNLLNLAGIIDPRIEIAFLRGPLTFGPGQHAWFPVRFGPNGPEIDAARADESRIQLITLLRAFRARDGAGAALPTVIAGFSQGGIMSAGVGLTSPDDVAAFAVLCGRILPEIDPLIAPRDALRFALPGCRKRGSRSHLLRTALSVQIVRIVGHVAAYEGVRGDVYISSLLRASRCRAARASRSPRPVPTCPPRTASAASACGPIRSGSVRPSAMRLPVRRGARRGRDGR